MQEHTEKTLKAIAQKVLEKTRWPQSQNYGSVIAILMVVSIILTSIRILQECNKTRNSLSVADKCGFYKAQIRDLSKKRTWLTKLRLKRVIHKELNKEEYKQYGNELLNSLLDIGDTLTDEEITILVEAANV